MRDYDIIVSDSVSKLIQEVKKRYKLGWEESGGVSVWPSFLHGTGPYQEFKGFQFAQAMVKKEKD